MAGARGLIRWAGVLLLAALAAGYSWGPYLVPISPKGLLDAPARMKIYETSPRPGADDMGAAVLNLAGQRLWADGNTLKFQGERSGTLRELLASLNEPWKYVLYEVHERDGRLMGYLLVHDDLMDLFHVDEAVQSIFVVKDLKVS